MICTGVLILLSASQRASRVMSCRYDLIVRGLRPWSWSHLVKAESVSGQAVFADITQEEMWLLSAQPIKPYLRSLPRQQRPGDRERHSHCREARQVGIRAVAGAGSQGTAQVPQREARYRSVQAVGRACRVAPLLAGWVARRAAPIETRSPTRCRGSGRAPPGRDASFREETSR